MTTPIYRTNNTLVLRTDELERIKTQMAERARVWRIWCALFIFVVVFGSWVWVLLVQFGQIGLSLESLRSDCRHGIS